MGTFFLPHLFIYIIVLFFLEFFRFILFYIYYICEHFSIWILYPSLLFNSLLFGLSVHYTLHFVCMHICLNFFANLYVCYFYLLFCWYVLLYIFYFVSSYLHLCNFCLKFSVILFMLLLLPHISFLAIFGFLFFYFCLSFSLFFNKIFKKLVLINSKIVFFNK